MDKQQEDYFDLRAAQNVQSIVEPSAISSAAEISSDASLIDRWSKQRGYGITSGGVNLLLPVGIYSELAFNPVITALPNSPQYFIGLLNMRGNLIPVYDLAIYINIDRQAKNTLADHSALVNVHSRKAQQVIILGKGDDSAALLCDSLPQTFELSINALSNRTSESPSSIKPFVARTFWLNNDDWFELDAVAMFTFFASEPSF